MLAVKGNETGQVGGLVHLEFRDLLFEDQASEINVFKLGLFGIVRYQRNFESESENEQIFGIKFVKTVDDERFINFLEKRGEPHSV